ncbi:MAG TPA: amidohydrolase [bacterium]|nr:amidohydrolase [bacterium]
MSVSPEHVAELKQRACARIDEMSPALVGISRKIWEHPELAFQERRACSWLSQLLRDAGYEVETGVGGLETAFTATLAGRGAGPTVGVFSEYDALPELGHGCGHNLLAISGVGAGVGLAAVLDGLPGAVRVHGTPAEEGPSGKTLLLRAGVFQGLDAALIFHPSAEANVLERMRTGQGIVFTFTGRHAHAAAHPELAVDALNGVLALFHNVNLLRQHFRPDVSVTGSIPNGGGRRAFPVTASARFGVRVFEGESDFEELREMVVNCARGAALATRTALDIEYGILERGMKLNETLTTLAVDNARGLGIELGTRVTMGGMSDFGNVSHLVPATHFSTATWPQAVTAHTPEAVAASCQPRAFEAALAAAKIEAMTTIDVLARPDVAARAKREFTDNDLGDIPTVPGEAGNPGREGQG